MGEQTFRGSQQGLGRVKFGILTFVNHENLVAIHHSLETVSNGHHCAVLKFFVDELLDSLFCFLINVCCCFIKDYNFGSFENSSTNADQ